MNRDCVVLSDLVQSNCYVYLSHTMKPKTSEIWQFFMEIDENFAKCKTCGRNYSRKGRTTTSLKGHLKSMHKEKYEEFCGAEKEREQGKLKQATSVTPLKQAKRQLSLEESPKKEQMWDTSHPKAKKMDDVIGEMIASENLPFQFVESIGFRRVMQTALPNYQLRERQFFTDHVCDGIYTKIATKIGHILRTFLKLSFTADIWSVTSASVSILSLTAHGITEDFTRMKIVLKCCSLHGPHTGDIICDNLKIMLREWNIQDEQLHCLIRDGGSNKAWAMDLADIPVSDVSCTVHQLQLCVRSALEALEVKGLITKCKEISGHLNHSQIAKDEPTKFQTEQFNQPTLHVIQDYVTRWHSTFHMIERLLKIKDSISLHASKHSVPEISPEEWLYLNKIVAILSPFEEITRNLSDTKTSISSVIPLIYVLKHTLQAEKEKSDTNQNFQSIIQKLIDDINSRFCDLPSNTLFSLATYLDPRYKLKFFNEITKEQVQSELIRLLTIHYSNAASGVGDDEVYGASAAKRARVESNLTHDEPSTSFQILPPIQSVHSNLAEMLTNSSDGEEEFENDRSNSNLITWNLLISEYNKENRLKLDDDPLLWWRINIKYKAFSPIVRTYLSAPSSSVSSEQLFSAAGLIYEPHRNHRKGDKAAKLLFVKYNLPLLNFDY